MSRMSVFIENTVESPVTQFGHGSQTSKDLGNAPFRTQTLWKWWSSGHPSPPILVLRCVRRHPWSKRPFVLMEHVLPAPVAEHVAPVPVVTYAAPTPLIEDIAPTPVTNAEEAPVDDYNVPAPAVSYAAMDPVVKFFAPVPAKNTHVVQAPATVEATHCVSQKRILHHTVEQNVDVPVPPARAEIVEVALSTLNELISERIAEQNVESAVTTHVDVPIPRFQENFEVIQPFS